MQLDIQKLDFKKGNGLIPVIIQDALSMQILMLGYVNEEALQKTLDEGKVTFFSRSKGRLWTKGEESGNFLLVKDIYPDCDNDTLVIQAEPTGPACHTGQYSCFKEESAVGFLYKLEQIIKDRITEEDEGSYTYSIYKKGLNKITQKVGEEAVELLIESKDSNDILFKNEAADLLYHLLILLQFKRFELKDIEKVLLERSK